jgi:hypothetical protein
MIFSLAFTVVSRAKREKKKGASFVNSPVTTLFRLKHANIGHSFSSNSQNHKKRLI